VSAAIIAEVRDAVMKFLQLCSTGSVTLAPQAPCVLLVLALVSIAAPADVDAQVTTLHEAIRAAEAANHTLKIAELERDKAVLDVNAAKTHRLPVFSVTALGSQPLTQLGITLERGALGVYPHDGPIPGQTTTLESPLQFGFIGYASVAQPLTQQFKIGLGIELAGVGVTASSEQLRAKRQAVVNDVRHLYYGIAQAESGRRTLQATVDFLKQLEREMDQQAVQRVVLRADQLNVTAQRVKAEYELLKMDDPIATQKAELNRLMGRPVDMPFDIEASTIGRDDVPSLDEAYAEALASRPEVRLAKLQQQKAELERRLANAERIPDLSLSLLALRTVNFNSTLPNSVSSVGLQLNWDVFDWGRKRQDIQKKRDTEAQAALELNDTQARIMVDVAHQYRRILEARKAVELAQALQAASAEGLRVTRNRYVERDAVLSDVVKTESSLAEANHQYTQALVDLATAQADFEKAVGRD
jgi:outer membrane protein